MEYALKTYLHKCKEIFSKHHSMLSKVVPIPGTAEPTKDNRQFFEEAIKDVEGTKEFEALASALGAGTFASDLERLEKKEARRRKTKTKSKKQSLDEWRKDTVRHAARGFFRNTGAYVKLWRGLEMEESDLISILDNYKPDSELIRLFIFDGFVPYHKSKLLKNISLPVGELKRYSVEELEKLVMLPQSSWYGLVYPEIIENAAIWHILTVREKYEYSGITGIWMGGSLLTPINWSEIRETGSEESDIEVIGPVFLCIGEDANLASEIKVKKNIFEFFPVHQNIKNDYLPWDSYDNEGEPRPRKYVHDIGKDGHRLRKIFEIWQRINYLDPNGFLRYPTNTYVRSLMILHNSWDNLMGAFVGFVTVIESLLTPGSRQELAYKTAIRGAALLSSDPKIRSKLFRVIDEFYKLRSQIVHNGHTEQNDNYKLYKLTIISRQIFLRYICLLYLGLNRDLEDWLLPDLDMLSSKNRRPKAISSILDSFVLSPALTDILEEKMKEWCVHEDWLRIRL